MMINTKNIDTQQDEDFEEFIFQDTIQSQVKQQNTYKLIRNVQKKKQNGFLHQKSNSFHVITQFQAQSRAPLITLKDQIKEIYLSDSQIPPLIKNMEGMKSFDLKDYYVNLKTVIKDHMSYDSTGFDEVIGEKVNFDINEIFEQVQEHDYSSRILLLGGAGVGKSTLMQFMAFKWSRNELWQNKFDVVYRVMLKTLLNNSWKHKYQLEKYQSIEIDKAPLKFLIHYNIQIIAEKNNQKCNIKPEDINLKEGQIAILLDGYDEVNHLSEDPTYKIIEQEIFEHQYIILTSRPNAVSNMFRQKFNRVIENNGLDRIGIQKYIEQYFAKDKLEIQNQKQDLIDLLDKNNILQSISNIPVNLAMLCYLFTQKQDDFSKVNFYNSCQLYKQVIQKLGETFIQSNLNGVYQDNGYIQKERIEAKLSNLPELNVIRYLAYIGLTGGGVEIEDASKKNGRTKYGACIEDSIETLNEKTTVMKILQFGLLKKEGVKKKNAQYSFIHLSFQEYLTAEYFTQKLINGSDKEKLEVLNYISSHRNEPRLLLTLKFMSGIITQQNELEVLNDFWNSMCCNVDGVIELSLEEKVKLLMHLLGQSLKPIDRNISQLDKRIPNLNDMVAMINTVVVNNISSFKQQIKESNFLSKNIIYIIESLMQGNDTRLEVLEKIKYSYSQNDFSILDQSKMKDKKMNLNQRMLEFIDFFYQQRLYYKTQVAQVSLVLDKAQTAQTGTNVSSTRRLTLILKGLSLASQIPQKINWDIFEKSLIYILESNESVTAKKNVLNMINQLFQTYKTKDSFQKQILLIILSIEKKYYENLKKQVQYSQNNPKLIQMILNVEVIQEDKECLICYQQNIPKSNTSSQNVDRPENNLYETIITTLKCIYKIDTEIITTWVNIMMNYSIHERLSVLPKLYQVALLVYNYAKQESKENVKSKSFILIKNFLKSLIDHIDIVSHQYFKQVIQQLDSETKPLFSSMLQSKLIQILSKKQILNEDLFENIRLSIQSVENSKDKDKLIKEICQIYFTQIKMEIKRDLELNGNDNIQYINIYLFNYASILSMLDNNLERQSIFTLAIDFFINKLIEEKEQNYQYLNPINQIDRNIIKCSINQQQFAQLTSIIISCSSIDSDNFFFLESLKFIRNLMIRKSNKQFANYLLVYLIKSLQGKQDEKIQIDTINIYELVDSSIDLLKNTLKEIIQSEGQIKQIKRFNYLINIILSQQDNNLQVYSFKVIIQCISEYFKSLQNIKSINSLFWNFLDQLKYYQINQQILEVLTQLLFIQDIHFEAVAHITKLFKDCDSRANIPQVIQTILIIKIQMGIKLKDFAADKHFYSSFQWQLDQVQDTKLIEELTKNLVNHCQKLIASIASNKSMEISQIKEKLDVIIKCILLFQNSNRQEFQIEYYQLEYIIKSLAEIAKNKFLFQWIFQQILTIAQSVKELKKRSVLSRDCYYCINKIVQIDAQQYQTIATLKVQIELIQQILLDQKRSLIIYDYINQLFLQIEKCHIQVLLHILYNIFSLFLLVEDNELLNQLIQSFITYLNDPQPNSINQLSEIIQDRNNPISFRLELANCFSKVFNYILAPNISYTFLQNQKENQLQQQNDNGNYYSTNLQYNSMQQQEQQTDNNFMNKGNIEKILLNILSQHKDDIKAFLTTESDCLYSIIQQIDSVNNFKQIEQIIKEFIDCIYRKNNYQQIQSNIEKVICSLLKGINNEEKRYIIIINIIQHVIQIIEQNDSQDLLKKLHMLMLSLFSLFDKPNKLISDTALKFLHCVINRGDTQAYEDLLQQKKFNQLLMLIDERDEKQIIEQLLLKFKIKSETVFNYLQQWKYKIIKKYLQFQEDDVAKINLINSIVKKDASKPNNQIVIAMIQLINMSIVQKSIKNSSKFFEQVFQSDQLENSQISIRWYFQQFSQMNKIYILFNLVTKYKNQEIKTNQLIIKFNQINSKYQLNYQMLDNENLNRYVNSNYLRIKEDIRSFTKNKFGFSYHKTIFLALNIIQFENDEYSDRKELINESKILLRNIINDLDEKAILWIIKNITKITSISYYSKIVFQKVIEILFKDGALQDTQIKINGYNQFNVLTNIINCNANIQINNKGYITIDGQKFKVFLKEEDKIRINQELSKMIRNHKNPFIYQYNTYQPLFFNTSTKLVASLDKQEYSIINSSWNYKLNLQEMNINSIWKLVELTSFNGERIIFFEQRDIFGKRIICKIDFSQIIKSVVKIFDGNLTKIFGEYNGPKMFFCSLFKNPAQQLKQEDVTDVKITDWSLIDGDRSLIEQFEKFEILRKYYTESKVYELYHDSLLKMEVTANRIQDITHFSFIKILKEYEHILQQDLQKQYPQDKKIHQNFIDYYHGFVKTFTLCLEEAQIILSDKFTYDKGGMGLNAVYQIVSFIPLVKDYGITAVQSVEEFIKDRNIKKYANAFLRFACDQFDLSEKSGKIAILIIKKMRDLLFKNQGYIDYFKQNYKQVEHNDNQKRHSFMQKSKENLKKLLEQVQSMKQYQDQQIQNEIYKGKYQLLGNSDATQFIQIIIQNILQKKKSPNDDFELIKKDIDFLQGEGKRNIFENNSKKQKQNCKCQIF